MTATPNPEDVIKARAEYTHLGFDTLPLPPGSKKATLREWQLWLPSSMWRKALPQCNIAIRAGGDARLVIMDLDDDQSVEHGHEFMSGLGYQQGDYPEVETASGIGRHFYMTMTDTFSGNSIHFIEKFGDGEVKHGSGSYVVAPPSEVGGSFYRWLGGDLRHLPQVSLADLMPILRPWDLTATDPIPQSYPRSKAALISGDPVAISAYPSRSEAEQSLVQSLYNLGLTFDAVLELFCTHKCAGKFKEINSTNPSKAQAWLRRSYDKAASWGSTHESKTRQHLGVIIQQALSTPWPGRTGSVDRDVYVAMVTIAHDKGKYQFQASARDLADMSGVTAMTANRANRICKTGLVSLEVHAVGESATVYQLIDRERNVTLPHMGIGGECNDKFPPELREGISYVRHDAFRRRGLGKTAAEIWEDLQRGRMTAKELAAATGRHVKTIRRVLRIMARLVDYKTGELMPMVEQIEEGKWKACPDVDLDKIAEVVGTDGAGKRQHDKHAAERRAHGRELLEHKQG